MRKRILNSVAALTLFGAALAGCGSAGGAGDFAGAFSGNFTSTITETAPVAQTLPGTTSSSLSITNGATSDMVIDLSTAVTGCLLNASRSGDSATVIAGQSCTESISTGSITLGLSNGTATITGNALSVSLGGNVTGSTNGEAITGTFSLSFMGSKK